MRLEGKVILVTGSTTGIGEAIARRFMAEGAKIVIHGRNHARAQALVNEWPKQSALAMGDLADPAVPRQLVETAVKSFGRLDGLVNNAALTSRSDLMSTDAAFFDR